jgi:hypothetical protein
MVLWTGRDRPSCPNGLTSKEAHQAPSAVPLREAALPISAAPTLSGSASAASRAGSAAPARDSTSRDGPTGGGAGPAFGPAFGRRVLASRSEDDQLRSQGFKCPGCGSGLVASLFVKNYAPCRFMDLLLCKKFCHRDDHRCDPSQRPFAATVGRA